MQYLPDSRVLTLGLKPCTACFGRGDQSLMIPCPTGGRGPRGGRAGCRTCHGSARHWDHDTRVPCERCHGEPADKDPETFYDSAPREALEALVPTLTVIRQDRPGTWNESYLGIGSLWSCTDYGRTWEANDDDALTAEIGKKLVDDRVQAVQIVKPFDRADTSATLVDTLVVIVHRTGYKVVAHGSDTRQRYAEMPV